MINIEFKYKAAYENQPEVEVVYTTNAVTLDEILPAFEQFLKGAGFEFNGHLDFINEEE
jgi:hypothetical protein